MDSWVSIGQNVMRLEAESILSASDSIGDSFKTAVEIILSSTGHVVCCGIGKSGNIARKVSGTLSSTGTPALFLHPSEAMHGELGSVRPGDIVLLFTNSGETDELIAILPSLKSIGSRLIGLTGKADSSIGQECEIVLNCSVEREACPMNLAPTSSAAVQLAMGDALAITLMTAREFSHTDFAQFHPSGSLGKRLLLRVYSVMRKGDNLAVNNLNDPLLEIMKSIGKAGAGASCIIDSEQRLLGIITDGDIRRRIEKEGADALVKRAKEIMNPVKYVIKGNPLAYDALVEMNTSPAKIGEMPVINEFGQLVGMIMLKDLLRSGII